MRNYDLSVNNTRDTVILWCGKDVRSLNKEELLDIIFWHSRELDEVRSDRDLWLASGGDVLKYLDLKSNSP